MSDEINVGLIKKLIEDKSVSTYAIEKEANNKISRSYITLMRTKKQDVENLTIGKARILQKVAETLYKTH
ncbi:hypothetical protein [Allofustis seminis]|uniref:hypothetical protein n=1 Tax=Allofustis seminis TaxID=166939 RepID=UPI000369A595|nr:hypothetical protein [Allofustis seminis]